MKEDIATITKAFDSNNIPYKVSENRITLQYNNEKYLKGYDKHVIVFSTSINPGELCVYCDIPYDNIYELIPKEDRNLFLKNQHTAVLEAKSWMAFNENVLNEIVRLFSVVNKAYEEAQNKYGDLESIDYKTLYKYIKPIIEVAYNNKYKFDKNNINEVKKIAKNEELIKSVVDFIESKI